MTSINRKRENCTKLSKLYIITCVNLLQICHIRYVNIKAYKPSYVTYILQQVHNFTNENRAELFTIDRHKKFSVS